MSFGNMSIPTDPKYAGMLPGFGMKDSKYYVTTPPLPDKPSPDSVVIDILEERKAQHGDFQHVAKLHCDLMELVAESENYENLTDEEEISLMMIMHKVSRICCGDPHFLDHWVDISGYATLIVKALQRKQKSA